MQQNLVVDCVKRKRDTSQKVNLTAMSDLKIGNIVTIRTMQILTEKAYMFEMLSCNIHQNGIGVIQDIDNDKGSFAYQVDWAIHGLFDISEDDENEKTGT